MSQPGSGDTRVRRALERGQTRAIFAHELLSLARDRRALFLSVVLPALLYPFLFWGRDWLEGFSRETLEARAIQVGVDLSRAKPELAELARAELAKQTPIELVDVDASALQEIEPEVLTGTPEAVETERATAQRILATAGADALLVALVVDGAPPLELRVFHDGADDDSREALRRVELARSALLMERSLALRTELLGNDPGAGLDPRPVDVATDADQSGAALGRFLPLIAVLVLLSGGSYAALAAFAGEREAGTLETLLVQPVPARSIVIAKFAAVLVAALATLVCNTLGMLGSAAAGLGSFPGIDAAGPLGSGGALGPGLARLVTAAIAFLPAVVLVCALLCLVCGRARTFREGQHLLLPLMLVTLAPTLLATQQDVRLDLLLGAIPLTGPALAARDALRGELDLRYVAWTFVAGAGWAWLALARVSSLLDAERVLSTSGDENEDARRAVQSQSALRWAIGCVFAIYLVGGTLQTLHTVWGLVATLCALVPLFAWLSARGTARRAKEGLATTLGLVRPRALHVLGALLCAPALHQIARAVFAWQQEALPLPVGFAQQALGVEISGLSTWGQLALLAIAPALGEELFFRGALWSGLKRDLPLWRSVGWEMLLFGAAHASIYRFVPTGLLGGVLTLVVARAGSLWPCVALHAGYNGLLVVSERWPLLANPWLAALALPGAACFLARGRANATKSA